MTIKIRWIGHAAFLIEHKKGNILIDPYISENPSANISLEELPKIDMIIVTHGHGDHLGDTIKIAKKHNSLVISNVEIAKWLKGKGVEKTHGQQSGGMYKHPLAKIKLTVAFHASSLPDGSYGGQPNGVLLTMEKKTIYHAGDTGLFSDMTLIGDEGIHLALLPIGDNFTMGPEDAAKAVAFLKPEFVIPMHYNTWPIIKSDPELFYEYIIDNEVTSIKLNPGDFFNL